MEGEMNKRKTPKNQRDCDSKPYSFSDIRIALVREKVKKSYLICNANDVFKSMQKEVSKLDRECFWILCLNSQSKVIGRNLVSIGSVNRTIASPMEIFKAAILVNAVNIILIHNHVSGELKPSSEDIKTTSKLKQAGDLLGIDVMDHVIISHEGYFSFQAEGLI
jgi:DNA repair protein RadC